MRGVAQAISKGIERPPLGVAAERTATIIAPAMHKSIYLTGAKGHLRHPKGMRHPKGIWTFILDLGYIALGHIPSDNLE